MRIRSALGAAVIATLAAGCASGSSSSTARPSLSEQQILEEYAAETAILELAAGETWVQIPPDLTLDSPDPKRPMRYEQGVGAQTAQFQWYCSWATEAIHGDLKASLDRLETFPTMSVWDDMDTNGHNLFEANISDAHDGNLGTLESYVSEYCPEA